MTREQLRTLTVEALQTRLLALAPYAPGLLRGLVARVLANPRVGTDTLLILADALAEAAEEAAFDGAPARYRVDSLRALAALLRETAPTITEGAAP